MCGRFEFKTKKDDLEEIFRKYIGKIKMDYDISEVLKEENIAPTDRIRIIVHEDDQYKVKVMKWAIKTKVMDYSRKDKEPYIEKDIFNSRIETLKKSPAWKKLLEENRCLVPMTAFYEWIPKEGKKEPQRINIEQQEIFFAGGIFEKKDLKGESSASIITCEPNEFMKPIHNRMPVLFKAEKAVNYLTAPKDVVASLCDPLDDEIKMESEKAKI